MTQTKLKQLLHWVKDCGWDAIPGSGDRYPTYEAFKEGYKIRLDFFHIEVHECRVEAPLSSNRVNLYEHPFVVGFSYRWYRPSTWGIKRLWDSVDQGKLDEYYEAIRRKQKKLNEDARARQPKLWEKIQEI